jgi:hypothetical protein
MESVSWEKKVVCISNEAQNFCFQPYEYPPVADLVIIVQSSDRVTIDGDWIGTRINWTPTTRNYVYKEYALTILHTLQITI